MPVVHYVEFILHFCSKDMKLVKCSKVHKRYPVLLISQPADKISSFMAFGDFWRSQSALHSELLVTLHSHADGKLCGESSTLIDQTHASYR